MIHVLEEDIQKGKPRNPLLCPVAQAYMREYQPDELAGVFFCGMLIGNDLYELPDDVKARIKTYDETGHMDPFEFELKVKNDCCPDNSERYR
jgi:hypothetical protein